MIPENMELCKSSFIFHINAGDSLSERFRDEDVNSSKANVVVLLPPSSLNHLVFNPLPSSLEVETKTTYCLKHEQETALKYPESIQYRFIENLAYFKSEQRDL